MKNYFGTDGIRGNEKIFTPEFIGAVVRAIAVYYGKPEIMIGRDPRRSGKRITELFAAAATAEGMRVTDAGMVPTPALAYLTVQRGAGLGVMVSASHNPPEYNGLKLFSDKGAKITTREEEELSAVIEKELNVKVLPPETDCGIVSDGSLIEEYISGIGGMIEADLSGMKVVIDGGFGAAGGAAAKLFTAFGATVELLNDADGDRINVGTGAAHPEYLLKVAEGSDLAFSYDGDGDRVMCVRKSRIVSGDEMMYIIAKNMIKNSCLRCPVAVGTIMTNYGAEEAFKRLGITLYRTPVGDKFVSEAMTECGAQLGGESSGHIILKDFENTGDGILTSLMVAKAFVEYGEDADEGYFEFPAAATGIPADDFEKTIFRSSAEIAAYLAAEERSAGVRIIARPSGTEPVIRLTVEAESGQTAQSTLSKAATYIKTFITKKMEITASEKCNTEPQNENIATETLNRIRKAGGIIVEPKLTYISPEVTVEKGAVIYPFVRLSGKTVIGAGAEVNSFSVLEDTVVGEGTKVGYTSATGAVIGKNCTVGPFTTLRKGAVIGDGCRVGDYVEVKNSILRDGVKAAHLAYIGDAEVGEGTNIGCGTVFANYDGKFKHRTEVGKNVFVGCNANLIAPIKVGDGAFIAGGSTVTDDVPAGEICFGRARQVNRPKKRKE